MPSPRVVLDTNIVISAHLNMDGLERYILDLALNRQLVFFLSQEILEEYASVLHRPKFRLQKQMVAASLELIYQRARVVRPKRALAVAVDPADDKFLECAESASADYLITGNKRHFSTVWKGTRIVNARELLNLIVPDIPR
jgi:putative PIN family toxin of toxin-antitoxin system